MYSYSYIFPVCDVKVSKTFIMFIVNGNSFNVNQFRRNGVVVYVLVLQIWKKVVMDTERQKEQTGELSR
jgi:hypothetical protein